MSYSTTHRSMELFSREVLPRFREEVYEPWKRDHYQDTSPEGLILEGDHA
jgi:hypothetical protein